MGSCVELQGQAWVSVMCQCSTLRTAATMQYGHQLRGLLHAVGTASWDGELSLEGRGGHPVEQLQDLSDGLVVPAGVQHEAAVREQRSALHPRARGVDHHLPVPMRLVW